MEFKDQIINHLSELIAIPSCLSSYEKDAPFGAAVRQALLYMLETGAKDGFSVKNVDNYGGHIEYPGQTSEIIAAAAHLDVVPPGDHKKWSAPPFSPVIKNGRIYGRGALDDKGPLMAVYYAMKRLKDSGYRPRRTIRLILGCDEETRGIGMKYYLGREKAPCAGFTPDGDFPVIHGEKGLLFCKISAKEDMTSESSASLLEFQGGTVPNMVPDTARFSLECRNHLPLILERLKDFCHQNSRFDVQFTQHGTKLQVTVYGKSAHGSTPEKGLNSISIACLLLDDLLTDSSPAKNFLSFYNNHLGFDLNGQRIGRIFSDSVSGDLIVNPGIISMEKGISLIINLRYPVTVSSAEIMQTLSRTAGRYGLTVTLLEDQPPLFYDRESPLIQTLLNSYRQYTKDTLSQPLISSGATYARSIPNTVAFGAIFPGDPDLCHQADEYIEINRLMTAVDIYTDALQKLDMQS